jgi:hypothetical protein
MTIAKARVVPVYALLTMLAMPAVAQPVPGPATPFASRSIERAVRASLRADEQVPARTPKSAKQDSIWNGILIGAGIGAAAGPLLVVANGGSDDFAAVSLRFAGVFGAIGALAGGLIDGAF